ncbi:hybrid sensor histidine kinase/response regulator [Roseomonas marmotae]|uniref:histidine kinase n=1 Tax=Roseomonas marmotae TaxID=2768161 RepID=A0ABS3KDI1_9PROT|nr:PAS domain-containing sensor histidine kinase [Roseomonas marmotae]MBO1075047.1 PAS domain S-box protein [Roseomonas marmotae]QTI79920.1 PAS domain S-box protein [Roseomonas marmotae]
MNKSASMGATNAYELLVQAVVDYAIFMLDPDGRVVSWNPGAHRIKGYSAGEIIGEHFSRFYTPEDREAGLPARALKAATEDGRASAEAWRVRKDGTRFWASVVIDAIHENGRLIGFAKVTRDMTEQRNAQIAALESERRFRLLVQGVTDYAIFMLNPDGRVTNWNTGAERIKGYTAEEIIGHHFSRFYTPEDVADGLPFRALETARREGRYEAEGWRMRKEGTRFWAGVVIDAIYEHGTLIGFAKITRDLTERRNAELELEASREQLLQAQKMEAIGQLTGGLAHDFNNMLTGITGSLELLKTRVMQGRTEDLERYIGAAQGAASRAAALTHRLLAFARRQTLDPKPTDPNRLILGMKELVERTVGPAIMLETELAPDLWAILCDPSQLENALLNLCINARDAMPDGGRLTIATSNLLLDGASVRDQDMGPGYYVAIDVADTGTGMEPEVVARAFDPFFTTKPFGMGTGLGLSMIYGFARQSGGQVKIRTEPGRGTTMRLYLPRHWGPAEAKEDTVGLLDVPRAEANETVAIIDDEPTVRMLVMEVLEELGYSAIEAPDGASGLKMLQSDQRIDLLITDVGLPGGMNGRQLADAARQMRPGLKVLFITGYAENVVASQGQMEPGMQVLTKPFAMQTLANRIKSMITAS